MTKKQPRRSQEGQAIAIIALVALVLVGFASLAIDQGLAMADRRDVQASADAAALASARQYNLPGGDVNAAHFVALQYLAATFNQSVPGSCTKTSCSGTTWTMGTYTFSFTDDATSKRLDVAAVHQRGATFAGILGVATENVGKGSRATAPGTGVSPVGYALAAVGGDAAVHGGGVKNAASGNVSGAVFTAGTTFGANNSSHAVVLPAVVRDGSGAACSPSTTNKVDYGGTTTNGSYTFSPSGGSTNTSVTGPASFAADQPTPPPGANFVVAAQAQNLATGHWQPGTYNGFYPNGGLLDPGVYLIKGVTSGGISLAGDQNANYGPAPATSPVAPGAVDTNGAVVIVLDSTDTGGDVNIQGAHLNGLDDLYGTTPPNGVTRDPQGTHNFVLFGATFPGNIAALSPSQAAPDMTGIMYMPNSDMVSHGKASWDFEGAVYVKTMTLDGGGNGTQVFNYVCNLSVVRPGTNRGGLVR